MSLFRSAEMAFYNLRIPREHAYEIVTTLGDFSVAQLIDPKPTDFHKPFMNTIKRCEETLNKLDGISKKARDSGLEVKNIQEIGEYLKELNRGTWLFIQYSRLEPKAESLTSTRWRLQLTPLMIISHNYIKTSNPSNKELMI